MVFSLANLPYWIFLAIGVDLFLLVMFLNGEEEDFDFDADVDGDVNLIRTSEFPTNLALESHSNSTINTEPDKSLSLPILGWLGFGKAPLILLLAIDFSSWGLSGWILNVALGSLIGKIPPQRFGLGGIVMIVSLIMSLLIGSLVYRPLSNIFASLGEDVSTEELIGCEGTLISKTLPYLIDGKLGQADVLDPIGTLITISVSLPQWARVIPHRGQKIVIIEQQEHSYIAIAKDSSDEDKWLNQASEF